jgi:hypothetical protein
MEYYYQNLLSEGEVLNTLAMCHNKTWDYFRKLNENYLQSSIDTIENSIYHLYNTKKNNQLGKYNLFLFADYSPFDKMTYIDLDIICKENSKEKRVTFGYLYSANENAEQTIYQTIIKSYLDGKCDYTDIQYVNFNKGKEEIELLDMIAKTHMDMTHNQIDVRTI